MGVKRVVFDALDILLTLLEDLAAQRRELHRLYHFLLESGLTGIITAKVEPGFAPDASHAVSMQFMSDCVIVLDHVSVRDPWVMKCRGSGFSESAIPMSITCRGVELTASLRLPPQVSVDGVRVSSGVERLDVMLGGGYIKGSAVLITGAPGTSKSTLGLFFPRPLAGAVDWLLKGPEYKLADGTILVDKHGFRRNSVRAKWWLPIRPGMTHAEAAMPAGEIRREGRVPDDFALPGYSATASPIFFGHYWVTPEATKVPLASNVACLDYSAGNGGPLVAYRFDGEMILSPDKFVAIE